ncbi:MAG: tRNA epoxyqueuosine(34) reductase QueG [Deltaproteobacteria bacterium]|nr:tRNA epoxyqueuosine(34) reductase QueG [Deltaproteobacteria bacterium]
MIQQRADGGPSVPGAAERISERARELGFHAVGFARAREPLADDYARFRAFLAAGRHGAMDYLASQPATRQRVDSPAILEGAETVVCIAQRYDRREQPDRGEHSLTPSIARYARGQDYHGFLRKRLGKLAAFVGGLAEGAAARAFCDAGPVLEQAWAVRAGLGFVGKNGLLILPGQGSWCLLGEVITTLPVAAEAYGKPIAERCGTCTACLEACPTGAFEAPFVLDPRRCVAYLTIESQEVPPTELRRRMGDHLFGCDDCQEVCPHNSQLVPPAPETTTPFEPHDRWNTLSLAELVTLDDRGWREVSRGTPLKRAGRVTMARNAVLVAAHRLRQGDRAAAAVLTLGRAHDDQGVAELAGQAFAEAAKLVPLS